MNKIFKRTLSIVMICVMLISSVACGKNDEDTSIDLNSGSTSISETTSTSESQSESQSENSEVTSETSQSFTSSVPSHPSQNKDQPTPDNVIKATNPKEIQTEMSKKMVEFDKKMNQEKKKKSNMVGYLHIPNTTISDVVVQSTDNDYYLRRNIYQEENFNGCYFADFRNKFYAKTSLSKNTVLYGHSMDDSEHGIKFGQLKKYINLDFAKNNQFIYFSTPTREMVWQIFAVFYTKTDFDYIRTNPDDETMLGIINHARKGSLHNYEDVVVTTKDNILTLSTCTYKFAPKFEYPNDYRYVVMAKLLPQGSTPTPSKVSANPNPVLPGKIYS